MNSLNRAAQYFLGTGDEILIKVNVLGFVQRPGQYLVPRHTDLLSLISFAGGFQQGAKLTKIQIIRKGVLDVSGNGRSGQQSKDKIMAVNVKHYFESGKADEIPTLQAGDMVLVTQSSGSKFKNAIGINSVFGVLVAGATVALIVDRLSR